MGEKRDNREGERERERGVIYRHTHVPGLMRGLENRFQNQVF